MKASLSHKKLVLSPRSVAKLAVKIFHQLAALARLELFSQYFCHLTPVKGNARLQHPSNSSSPLRSGSSPTMDE